MFEKVAKLLLQKSAGVSLLCAGLLALLALVAGPSSAAAATASGSVTTNHWKSGSSEGYTLNATVTVPVDVVGIATVILNGPRLSAPVELVTTDGGASYSASPDLTSTPVVGDNYTLGVTYLDPDSPALDETLPVAVTGVITAFATPTAPLGAVVASTNPTFSWTPPAVQPAGGYLFTLDGADILWSAEFAPDYTSTPYVAGAGMPAAPTPGVLYNWSISTRDSQGNSAEYRTSFMLGTNFTGKLFGPDGVAGVADASIYVYDAGVLLPITGTTLSDGSYLYGGLATGHYTVQFSSGTDTVFYNNQADLPLTSGVLTTGVNAVIGGGSISGSVYLDRSATPTLSGVTVALYDTSRLPVASVPSNTILTDGTSFGYYDLAAVPAGNFYVKFSSPGYADLWSPLLAVTEYTTTRADVTLSSGIPVVNSFSVPSTSSALTVTGISVSATERYGVAYLLTESPTAPAAGAAGWNVTAPTSYTFASGGSKTLYAWAKGYTGKVSLSLNASVSITVPVNGSCGSSNGGVFTDAPATGLCTNGSASGVSGSGPWDWTCSGTNGGTTATCGASLQGATITVPIPLLQGWNLISLPVQPNLTAVGSVMGALSYRNVWGYAGGSWQMYDPNNLDSSDMGDMNSGAGYWIYATGPATLQLQGTTAPKSKVLTSGWNLVGYSGTVALDVIQATNSMGADLDKVWGFNAGAWQMYDPSNLDASDLAALVPGRGYWIRMKQPKTWTLP